MILSTLSDEEIIILAQVFLGGQNVKPNQEDNIPRQ
jgi:hypothetical protein